ncbi:MAG: group I intron-associated PD-(D/E)XK endonuclease [Blastocatellia bacterium]
MNGHTTGKGNLSESKVLTAYIEAGFLVSLPFGGGAPYDLVVDTGERLLKVQVKTGRLRNGCVLFAAQRISGHHGTKRRRYEESEFDVYAVYCPDNDRVYVIPRLGDLAEGRLRVSHTRNNQKQNIRWAGEFEFEAYLKNAGR